MKRPKALSNSRADLQSRAMATPARLTSKVVKLQLAQPDIICSGRRRVEWSSKGTILIEHPTYYIVEFKTKGVTVTTLYDRDLCYFVDEKYRDIKLIET